MLSAGTVHSPKILMHSGIGPAEQLRQHGIAVIVDSPEVGENLHDHSIVPVRAYVKGDLGYHQAAAQGLGTVKAGLRYFVTKDGPASGNGIETVSHWNPSDFAAERAAVESVRAVRKVVAQESLAPVIAEEVEPGPRIRHRDRRMGEACRDDDVSPGRHVPDGPGCASGGRCKAQGPRGRRSPGNRRLDHAEHKKRQYKRPDSGARAPRHRDVGRGPEADLGRSGASRRGPT